MTHTVMSKCKLLELVESGEASGWDDPRMPTLSGLRRRGYTPEAIRDFCAQIGVAKRHSVVSVALLDHCLRQDLEARAPRVMAVLNPLKVVIDNYPENREETLRFPNHPMDEGMGSREVPFSRVLYIERDDFREDPPRKFFRLAPGREVRLRYAYYISCADVIKDDATGEIVELRCTYDPESKGGSAPDGRKVKGTLHWVSAEHALDAEVRLYGPLFLEPETDSTGEGDDMDARREINPDSLKVLTACKVEPSLKGAAPESRYQFERTGYFCVDASNATSDHLAFNRTVPLRDTWAKIEKTLKARG